MKSYSVFGIIFSIGVLVFNVHISAAPLFTVSDSMERINESISSGHTIRFVTPSGVGSGEDITITFPAGEFAFGGSYDFNDMELYEGNTSDCNTSSFTPKSLASTPSGSTWGGTYGSDVVTITSDTDTISANTCVLIVLNSNGSGHDIINPTVTVNTSFEIIVSAGASDIGNLSVVILDDLSTPDGDQIEISGRVITTLSLDIDVSTVDCNNNIETSYSNNVVNLGTLVPGTPKMSSTGINFICVDIATNAENGVVLYIQSSRSNTNGGLVNGGNIIESLTDDLNSGSVPTGYGVRVSSIGTPEVGGLSIASPFNSSTPGEIGLIPGANGSPAQLVTATGPIKTGDSSRVAVEVAAKADTSIPSGQYTDILTFTAIGVF